MKSSLEKIDNEYTRQSELLSARLNKIDSFQTDEEYCRPKKDERKNVCSSALLPKQCLFCRKYKYKKRCLEKLTQCVDARAVESIRRAAMSAKNFHMISLPSQDLIATETFYHGTCYKSYVKEKQTKTNVVINEEDTAYKNVELSAFKDVVTVCHNLIMSAKVIPFVNFVKKMEKSLSNNHQKICEST